MEFIASELPKTIFMKELEGGPRTVGIEATESECDAIAKRLSIDSLSSLKGHITLEMPSESEFMINEMLFDGPVIVAEGSLQATLKLTCVVTLEQFETMIESSFGGVFTNADPFESINEEDDEGASDLPDILGPLGDEIIDIGEVFIEQLALEIDPFPRKPEAKFDGFSSDTGEKGDSERDSPFAVLVKLKEKLE